VNRTEKSLLPGVSVIAAIAATPADNSRQLALSTNASVSDTQHHPHTSNRLIRKHRSLAAIALSALLSLTTICASANNSPASSFPKLNSAVIRGSTAYSPTALFSVYRDQLGREINVDSARAIINSIEDMYVRDGYYKPQITVRDDLLRDGILRIDVYELQITQIRLTGNAGPYTQQLDSMGDALRQHTPLRSTELQKTLQQMRALPGLQIFVSTESDTSHKNALILKLDARYEPVTTTLRWTNRGTREIGPDFLFAQLVANGVFGRREQTGVVLASARAFSEYHGAGVFGELPLNDRGTQLTAIGFKSVSHPDIGDEIALDYRHTIAALTLTQSLMNTSRSKLSGSLALDLDDSLIDFEGNSLEAERLRVLAIAAQWNGFVGKSSQYAINVSVRRGLDALGAGLQRVDVEGMAAADFWVTGLEATSLISFAHQWSVRFDATAQWSGDVLPYTERFKIGTERIGRAFETAEFAGDSGVGLKAELRRRFPSVPTFLGTPSIYTYSDYGVSWKHDTATQEYASTAGIGIATDYARANGSLEVGKAMSYSGPDNQQGMTLLGEISYRF
jgi:hemolysin activation/secretion protein